VYLVYIARYIQRHHGFGQRARLAGGGLRRRFGDALPLARCAAFGGNKSVCGEVAGREFRVAGIDGGIRVDDECGGIKRGRMQRFVQLRDRDVDNIGDSNDVPVVRALGDVD